MYSTAIKEYLHFNDLRNEWNWSPYASTPISREEAVKAETSAMCSGIGIAELWDITFRKQYKNK